MKKAIVMFLKTMTFLFIVFCVYVGTLFFRSQRVPGRWVEAFADYFAPTNLVVHVDSFSFGIRHGISVRGLKLYDTSMADPTRMLAGADYAVYNPFSDKLLIEGAKYTRLPDSYYAPGNKEKNARVECEFPKIDDFTVTLLRPDILAVRPDHVTAFVRVRPHRIDVENIHLVWPDADNRQMAIDGYCYVDLDKQEVYGEVKGLAKQLHIRPMLVAIDVPVALPYMDAFTEVPEPCPAGCSWKVDLVRADLDLWLDLRPILGKYNTVPMKRANGRIHLQNYTRGTSLNYLTTVGPIEAEDPEGHKLSGTVTVLGTNGYNVVDVAAKSAQPLADVLKIGGFMGDYVGDEVFGDSECNLQFRFPRAMTNNYEVLNGNGHISVRNGQLMRMKGFRGLVDAMPKIAPAVTWFSDTTQASCDYTISNGVIRTDNTYIEGSLFSIKMYGQFDAVKDDLDFTVRVQFTKKDSFMGKLIHPLTWPFTKLLLEFRMTGSPAEPKWEYITVIDRVLEAVK